MSDHEDDTAPHASLKRGGGLKTRQKKSGGVKDTGPEDTGPKTPKAENGKGVMTEIGLTPIESLLFFNMVRFNKNHSEIDWNQVAIHSNLKNAASAKVRFRQILKKHKLLAYAPETPRAQAQKRKAADKAGEGPNGDDDLDVNADIPNDPSPVPPKTAVRTRPIRAGGGRTKKQKIEETDTDGAVVAPAPTPMVHPDQMLDTNPSMKIETGPETKTEEEAKTDARPGSDDGTKGVGILDVDGTSSANPHEFAPGQLPQSFGAGWSPLMGPTHHQGGPPANIGEAQMMQYQLRHHAMVPRSIGSSVSHPIVPPLTPDQLGLFHPLTPQLQPQQMTIEGQQRRNQLMRQAQAQRFSRFEPIQMQPDLMEEMPGSRLPFGQMTRMQLNEHLPEDAYHGRHTYFDQAHFGHGFTYGNADLDGQDEWDVESDQFRQEAKPEDEAEGKRETKPKFEETEEETEEV